MRFPDRLSRLRPIAARLGPSVGVAAGLLVLPLALFAGVTLGGRTLVPYDALRSDPVYRKALAAAGVDRVQNGLVADLVYQNVVWKTYLQRRLEDGDAPLWSPYIAGGMPFLAAGQHSAFYPTSLLLLLMRPDHALGWGALVNLWLAALCMYALGRVLGCGRFAAALMGLAWSSSTLFVANAVFPMIQAGMTWLPVILAGITAVTVPRAMPHRGAAGSAAPTPLPATSAAGTLGWLAVIAVATLLAALAGHPEILYYDALVAAAYAAFRLVRVARRHGWVAAARLGMWLASAGVVGALVAAVQLVPLAELAGVNWRGGAEPYDRIADQAFGIRQAITFVVPDFFGNPAHHSVPALHGERLALADDAVWGTAYGAKNYVEAASYVSILVLLLAPLGLAGARRRRTPWFFAGLALVSLSFVFGLPTYKLLFYGLPGFDQLRTPFRWVFPLCLALVVLAGRGADRLARGRPVPSAALGLGSTALAAGAGLTVALGTLRLRPSTWTRWVEALFDRLPRVNVDGGTQGALDVALTRFPDSQTLAAYLYWSALHLALFLTLGGVVVLLLAHAARTGRDRRPAMALALAAVALDLGLIGYGFNPSVPTALADIRPPAVVFLKEAVAVKWGRVTAMGTDRALWPNSAMREGIPDIRGYDSIFPRWTVEVLDAIERQGLDGQGGPLRYNRIGNLTQPASLAHPALAMLGVRYVVATDPLTAPGLDLIYEGEVRVYENHRALRRAWVVNQVKVFPGDRPALLAELATFDPASTVLLEEAPDLGIWDDLPAGRNLPSAINVRRDTERSGRFEVDVSGAPSGGLLVLSEAWFPGWRASVEVAGPGGPRTVDVPVYRANGMLRAVPVPPGRSTVRLWYSPLSLKAGLYGSFLGLVVFMLALAWGAWARVMRRPAGGEVGRIAVNTAGPVAANLLNKAVLFAFAMLMYRVLGPEEAGAYTTAVTLIGLMDIVTNFGLNLLATREVARDPSLAPRYLTGTAVLRLVLWVLAAPALAGYIVWAGAGTRPLSPPTVQAIALFALGLVPSNLSAAVASIFQARERMVLPAAVSIVSTLVSVSLGALALLAGHGLVGLAAVSIVTNWVTFGILATLAWRDGIRPAWGVPRSLVWGMVGVGLPLMLNHLLQTLFFKVDVLLLRQLLREGETVVGWYSTAYKWIDALLILPAFFTMALFPMMSRRAMGDRAGLTRAFEMGQRWLVSVALPIAVATTFLADGLVTVLAGAEFVPEGSTALKVMIWFLPLSFANGLTQYVLIALDRARWITVSFVVAVAFNFAANWLVIPGHTFGSFEIQAYTYVGAAVVTIVTEAVLRLPFGWGLRDLGAAPLVVILWRPAVAAGTMAAVMGGLDALGAPALVNAVAAVPVYLGVLAALGGITPEDRALARRVRGGG